MSYSLDTNVLLYATFEEAPHHEQAIGFLKTCRASRELICLTWPALLAFLRIATHPRIWPEPLRPQEAMENVEALLGLSQVRCLGEGESFWTSYRELNAGVVVRGNLVADAHIAAVLHEHGVKVIYTNDRDFRKFDFLEPRNPFL